MTSIRHRLLARWACCIVAISVASVSYAQPATRKVAFLVGVSDYDKANFINLSYAETDMRALKEDLLKAGFEVTLMLGSNPGAGRATLANLLTELNGRFLDTLRTLNKADIVLIVLSGHGQQAMVQKETGRVEDAFFCPVDAFATDPTTMLSIGDLMDALSDRSGAENNLLVIDACRDSRGKGKGIDGSSVSITKTNLGVLFAASSGTTAYESDDLKSGLLAYYFREGLSGQARDFAGNVTWDNLVGYVRSQVPANAVRLVGSRQLPHAIGSLRGEPPVLVATGISFSQPEVGDQEQLDQRITELLHQGRFREALGTIQAKLDESPLEAGLLAQRGRVYMEFSSSLEDKSYATRAESDLNDALRIDLACVDAWIYRSQLRMYLKQYDKALSDVNYALKLSPKDVRGYLARSWVYDQQSLHSEMDRDTDIAFKLRPLDAEVLNTKGTQLFNRGRFEEGLTWLDRAIQQEPLWAMLHNNRAYGLANLDLQDKALVAYKQAADLANEYEFIWEQYLTYVADVGSNSQIEQAVNTARERFSGSPKVMSTVLLHLPAEMSRQHQNLLDGLIKRFPDDPSLRCVEASWQLQAGDAEGALNETEIILKQHPDNRDAQDIQFESLVVLGRLDGVLEYVTTRAPSADRPGTLAYMVDRLISMERQEDALRVLEKGLAIAPDHVGLKVLQQKLEGDRP